MYRRIVVALDGSAFSAAAVPYAAEIAARAGAAIELVRVHVPEPIDDDAIYTFTPFEPECCSDPYARLDRAALRIEAEEMHDLTQFIADETGLSISARVVVGEVNGSLGRRAEALRADLIVMSTHARRGLERLHFGSVAEAVVRIAKMPVLLVQPGAGAAGQLRHPWFRRVLVPLDGSRFSEEVLPAAGDLARLFGASVFAMHVETGPPEFGRWFDAMPEARRREPDWRDRVRRSPWLPARTRIETIAAPDAAAAIVDAAERNRVDVIAMATHGGGGPSAATTGSTAFDVVQQTRLPVLVRRPFHAWSDASHLGKARLTV